MNSENSQLEYTQAASYGIDWFQGTMKGVHHREDWMTITLPPIITLNQSRSHCPSINGYTEAWEWSSGIKVMRHPSHPQMGVHIVISGEAWRKTLEVTGLTDRELVSYYDNSMFKVSRVDVRCDGFNMGIKPKAFYNAVEQDEVVTNLHSKTFITGIDTGADTLYIGSLKKRQKLLRIYDKGLQSETDLDWIRFEAEFRNKYATSASQHLFRQTGSFDVLVQELIVGIADFPSIEQWRILLSDNGLKIVQPLDPVGNTKKWLLTTVARSLANEVFKDADFEDTFMSFYKSILNELIDDDLLRNKGEI